MRLAVSAALLAALACPLAAQDRPGRYTMTPSGDGMVRLDTETGEVSLCAKRDNDWSCAPVADSAKRLQGDNERLAAENRALKDEIAKLDPGAPPSYATPGAPQGEVKLPTEEDVDKAFDYVEGMMKKFQERLNRLQEQKKSEPL